VLINVLGSLKEVIKRSSETFEDEKVFNFAHYV